MNSDQLAHRLQQFALNTIRLSRNFQYFPDMPLLRKQLIKAVTSAAANYRAARCGRSRKEWYAKLCIATEEMDEGLFWLECARQLEYLPKEEILWIENEAKVLTKILTKMRSSAKQKGI
jgi:four helix bundle protein